MSKEEIAERFTEADVAGGRFVSVKDGEKMCVDHDTRYDDPRDVPGRNYGIYCDEDDQLVVLDVDVHRGGDEEHDDRALVAIAGLGLTLRVRSPHADGEIGGHRIFKLSGDETPAELFERVFGKKNPVPSWGEVISKNKYVVGPGSQLDGCDKDWCDRCATADGGWYDVDDDRAIATVEPDELADALAADPDLERTDTPDPSDLSEYEDGSGSHTAGGGGRGYDDLDREQVEELLDAITGEQDFPDWIATGYAVYDWDDGATGKEVFEEWSRTNKKWERQESQRQIDYIWKNGESGEGKNNASVGTLVHKARENGYDGALGTSKPEPDKENSTDWADVRAVYDYAQSEQEYPKGNARMAAANVLERETAFMHVLESEILWVYDDETGTYGRYGRSYAARRLEQNLREHFSSNEAREIIQRLEARNQVHRKEINARQHSDPLVCVGNGVVNLRTGELLEHSPEYRFVRGLDVDHGPEKADPRKITEFLDDITEREADRDTLLDHLAHGLMPGHPYRAFVVCYGPGGNGKTQLAELFRGFVGRENAAAVEIDELAAGDFATGDLPGTFLNWGDDMAGDGGGQLTDLSLLKKATGGSEIRSNEKYEKIFNFKNEAAMFFSANEPPRIGEQKNSIADRIYPIEMPYKFKSDPDPENPMEKPKTPNVSKRLLDDDSAMCGLLQLAVEHAQKLIESRGEYSQPETPQERLEKYNQSADPIVNFATRILQEADANTLMRKDDVYRVYQSFTESQNERAASERGFKRQLPAALSTGVEDAQSRGLATAYDESDRVRCWKRLKWTETAKRHMPDWMVDRYADHFQDVEAAEESGGTTAAAEGATAELEALEPGFTDVTVTIAEKLDPPEWLEGKGHLVDDDGNLIPYVCEGANPFAEHVEGDTIALENVKIEERKAGPTAVLSGVTTAETDDPATPTADDQTGLDAATDGGDRETPRDTSVTTDGLEDPRERLRDAFETAADGDGLAKKVPLQSALKEWYDVGDAQDLIEKALREGWVDEPASNMYRRVSLPE